MGKQKQCVLRDFIERLGKFYRRNVKLEAFTLIELMVVIVILGILAAFVVPRITKRPEDAKVTKAKIEISNLEQALELYYLSGDPTESNNLANSVKLKEMEMIFKRELKRERTAQ